MCRYLGIILFSVLTFIGCQKESNKHLNIAAAANMQYALTEIIGVYNAQNNTNHKAVFSSSGKLNAQIKQGAPFDVFVSADMKYAQDLYESGFSTNPPKVYAYGKLVMWSYDSSFNMEEKVLSTKSVKHISIANPRTAPYGRATKEYLEGKGLFSALEPKFVYGEGVGQTNQFITSGAAEVGFTAKSVILSGKMKDKGVWVEIDERLYSPIAQGFIIINKTKHLKETENITQFIQSKSAQDILNKYGYEVP